MDFSFYNEIVKCFGRHAYIFCACVRRKTHVPLSAKYLRTVSWYLDRDFESVNGRPFRSGSILIACLY